MIITCKTCGTSFNLDDKMLKPSGSKVRCSVCANVFTAYPQAELPSATADVVADPEIPVPPPEPVAESITDTATETVDSDRPMVSDLEASPLNEDIDLDFDVDDADEETGSATEIEEPLPPVADEDLSDISFETESIPDPDLEADDSFESDATMIASLDDDDTDLDLSSESVDAEAEATVIVDLDDDDFDLAFDDLPDAVETTIVDLDQDDLGMELTDLPDDTEAETATIVADLDALDLENDFSLEPDDDASPSVPAEEISLEADDTLNDLDLALDLESSEDASLDEGAETETLADSADELSLDFDLELDEDTTDLSSPEAESINDDLDLTLDLEDTDDRAEMAAGEPSALSDDLDLSLDLDESDADATVPEGETAELLDDLDLTLDFEDTDLDADQPSTESPEMTDDLDLSSLESLLNDDGGDEDSATMIIQDEEEPELSLELDEEPSAAAAAVEESSPADTLDDLELDLDDEAETIDVEGDADQEIDLSEIEKMLEEPDVEGGKFAAVPDQDLDLDIEASLETEKWMSGDGKSEQLVMDEELDLSELEEVLEDVNMDATDERDEEPELELTLDDDGPLGAATETIAVDDELDFDLSDFEEKSTGAASDDGSGDMELDFELEENGGPEETLEDENLEATVAVSEVQAEKPAAVPPKPDVPPQPVAPPSSISRPVKKGKSKSIIVLLIILILGAAAGALYFLSQSGIEIPFVSDYLKPKVQDPGNLKLTTSQINSKFVDNINVGKLFVISGMVQNGYSESRGMATLVGKLFSKGKVAVNEEKVYAGNIMSDLELANLEWDKIQARLSNRLGDNRSNVKIEPGKSIPFMVVFSNLPGDLEEFTIEVVGSTVLK
ncbi:hypothetical protein DSCO28_62730 [Desulfosarcina ovata subsp. sediminis]|uniref:Zinc finger/thioredoxin putative domain-containing protein n=1 Tax=Desulfosarcina ovata subsp. sediminis TaxID=885957 RepID=A0A5K7ZZL8_9BACT|nr:zinc-ribbon domain-containing protein [Desulfosarcina ovata]BBO85707.1 hypothetical protein DSCO28_62730 [Desulfosarcina ovata subsp. sediminis]